MGRDVTQVVVLDKVKNPETETALAWLAASCRYQCNHYECEVQGGLLYTCRRLGHIVHLKHHLFCTFAPNLPTRATDTTAPPHPTFVKLLQS